LERTRKEGRVTLVGRLERGGGGKDAAPFQVSARARKAPTSWEAQNKGGGTRIRRTK